VKTDTVLPKDAKSKVLLLLVLISLLMNLWMSFDSNSVLALVKEVAYDGNIRRVYLVTGMDQFLEKVNPPGNVVLKFNGFKQLNRGEDDTGPLVIYFRSVYYLYPQKVFTVPPGTKVNDGEHILANPFHPNLPWMQENGVSTVISINKAPDGKIYNQVQNIPLIQIPPQPKEQP